MIDHKELNEKTIKEIIQYRIDMYFDIWSIGDPSPALLSTSLALGEKQVDNFFSVRICKVG